MKSALQIVSFSANKAWEASFWLGFHLFQKDLHSAFGFKVFNYLLLICLFILTKIYRCFTIQDGPFWGCSLMRGGKKASLPKTQWSYNDETWYKHVLHKEDLKYVWITWHTPWILLTSEFFQRKSANLAISRNTNIDCILVHNFCYFLRSGFAASSII